MSLTVPTSAFAARHDEQMPRLESAWKRDDLTRSSIDCGLHHVDHDPETSLHGCVEALHYDAVVSARSVFTTVQNGLLLLAHVREADQST